MVRSAWAMPMTLVQKFEANEAVAAEACLGVKCESQTKSGYLGKPQGSTNHPESIDGNPWGRDEYLGASPAEGKNHEGTCKRPIDNGIIIDENGAVSYNGADGGGRFVTAIDSVTNSATAVVDAGDRVYWCTDSSLYKWNHWGTVIPLDLANPNRS